MNFFADGNPSYIVRNNPVSEVISCSCSGCLENLISHILNEKIVKALIKLETLSSGFIIVICSILSIFTNSKFISFGLFYLTLSGNDCVLLTILYIDMPFI